MGKKYNKEYFKTLKENSSKLYDQIPALNWGEMVNEEYKILDRYVFKWKFAAGKTKTLTPLPKNLHEYIVDFKNECELGGRSVSAFVGTDSQNHLSYTRFITVICLQVERNGVHILVSKLDLPKIYDYRYKLLRETDISAEFLRNNKDFFKSIGMSLEVHSDFNSLTNHKSNGVVTESSNYLKTHGFNMEIKPKSWAASFAADYWC